jgi:hypothetical protein
MLKRGVLQPRALQRELVTNAVILDISGESVLSGSKARISHLPRRRMHSTLRHNRRIRLVVRSV